MLLKACSPVIGPLEGKEASFFLGRSKKPLFEVTINCTSSLL
jgi:hypothetical protein